MNTSLPKVVAVVGATATGKSALAIEIAKRFSGEVISADSRQVYKGLDLSSGKVTREEMEGVPHHLLDVATPGESFSVSQYKNLSQQAAHEILSRGNLPIFCGGTGFYLEAALDNVELPDVPPDPSLRAEMNTKNVTDLYEILKSLDPERAATVDPQNPRRIVRAIEIARSLGSVPKTSAKPLFDVLSIGIKRDSEELRERIRIRLRERIDMGMIEEIQKLHDAGASWEWLESLGLEARYIAYLLQKKIPREEMLEKLEVEIWRYAKRQRTWFKRDSRIEWFDGSDAKEILQRVEEFLKG